MQFQKWLHSCGHGLMCAFFSIGTCLRDLNLTGIFPLKITENNKKLVINIIYHPSGLKQLSVMFHKCCCFAEDLSMKTTNCSTVQLVTFLFFIHDKLVLFTWRYQQISPCTLEIKSPTAFCFIYMLLSFKGHFFSGYESLACWQMDYWLATEDWLYSGTLINELLQLYLKKPTDRKMRFRANQKMRHRTLSFKILEHLLQF